MLQPERRFDGEPFPASDFNPWLCLRDCGDRADQTGVELTKLRGEIS